MYCITRSEDSFSTAINNVIKQLCHSGNVVSLEKEKTLECVMVCFSIMSLYYLLSKMMYYALGLRWGANKSSH